MRLYILGILLSAALYFASPALVSPFMSVVLIANVIFAHFLLGEPFGGKVIAKTREKGRLRGPEAERFFLFTLDFRICLQLLL
jgi:hypothetical protein